MVKNKSAKTSMEGVLKMRGWRCSYVPSTGSPALLLMQRDQWASQQSLIPENMSMRNTILKTLEARMSLIINLGRGWVYHGSCVYVSA